MNLPVGTFPVPVVDVEVGDRIVWAGIVVEVVGIETVSPRRGRPGRWFAFDVGPSQRRRIHYYDGETVPVVPVRS